MQLYGVVVDTMGAAVLVSGAAVAVGGGAEVFVGTTAVVGGTADGVAELAVVEVGNGIGVEVVVDVGILVADTRICVGKRVGVASTGENVGSGVG